MRTVLVVSSTKNWPLQLPDAEVVSARDYLIDPAWTSARGVRVYNLCRSYRYQTEGFYVSLLAQARRHRPFPSLMTILDMKSRTMVRSVDEDLDELIERSLSAIRSDKFVLSVYFGRNMAKRYERLSARLFSLFPAPLLRAQFIHGERWHLTSVAPVSAREIPPTHHPFVLDTARQYFTRPRSGGRKRRSPRYDLAILHNPAEKLAPSNSKALRRFCQAAEKVGFRVDMIQRDDFGRLAEFDALFIRETTAVNHHTFRFAQRAESEGLVVIDDPQSILRCTNKVFQAEVFELRGVPTPRTFITDGIDPAEVERRIGYPCVLKYPDSSFSQGVVKCADAAELKDHGERILEQSDLLLVQEYMPSEYDWRIGIFEGKPLYAARYHMAKGHWQVIKREGEGDYSYGRVEPVVLADVPTKIVRTALRAAAAIGDGLYGVDLKQAGSRIAVTEVNDNPNIDAGCEDAILKDELYGTIMAGFLRRVEARKGSNGR